MKDKKTEQVYRWALQYITEHRFSNEIKMPSENAAKRILGVSRQTVHTAYDQLAAEGYIDRQQGSGTYICKDRTIDILDEDSSTIKICLILQGRATSPSDIMIEGMKDYFCKYNVSLHIYITDNKFFNERKLLQSIGLHGYAAYIVDGVRSGYISPNLDCYKKLYQRKFPVIFYNNYYRELSYPKVTVNNEKSAQLLIDELINAGHRQIAGIFVYDNIQSIEKFHGMLSALHKRNINIYDDYIKWISSDDLVVKSTQKILKHFLNEVPKATAIVCCNIGVYKMLLDVLAAKGCHIPEDYSVVCFDYTDNDYKERGITCTVHRGYDLGSHIAIQLMQMIQSNDISEQTNSYKLSPLLYKGTSVRKL